MIASGLMTSNSEEWETPEWLFDRLDSMFGFDLDACATAENAKCARYYTKADDGLAKPWGGVVWCNPPYGRELPKWVRKAYKEAQNGACVVMLIPARTDTAIWKSVIFPHAAAICFVYGRLRFSNSKASAPFPSAIVVFKENTIGSWR